MRKKMQELDKDSCIFLHYWLEFYERPDKMAGEDVEGWQE